MNQETTKRLRSIYFAMERVRPDFFNMHFDYYQYNLKIEDQFIKLKYKLKKCLHNKKNNCT